MSHQSDSSFERWSGVHLGDKEAFRAGWDAAVAANKPKTVPSVEDVARYMSSLPGMRDAMAASATAQDYVDYYESCGWKIGSKPMKSWQAAARRWVRNNQGFSRPAGQATFKEIPACN